MTTRRWDLGLWGSAKIVTSIVFVTAAAILIISSSDSGFAPRLSWAAIGLFVLALTANTLLAAVRLQAIAGRQATPVSLMAALQANAAAAVASLFMFAFVGQAAGRAAILHKSGMSTSMTVSLSLIERVMAALVLGVAAVFAALFLFGRLTAGDDLDAGYFFRVLICLLIAAGVVLGTVYRGFLPLAAKGVFSRQVGEDLLIVSGLSVLVHLAMLAAYVALAVGFEATLSAELVAACLVVMFAASLPISFGGWGVREISAGIVLSLVGLSPVEGVAIGAAVGIGSLVVQLGIAALSLAKRPGAPKAKSEPDAGQAPPDYALWLGLLTPILASFAVIFGLHLTVQGSAINLNLADPLAILGGILFVAYWLEQKRLPLWQPRHLNLVLIVLSGVMALSALHGFLEFGYSAWAIRNRLIGWFVLLSFMATGALFVARLGASGCEMLLKGFVVALCAVAGLEMAAEILARSGLAVPGWSSKVRLEGFSQNANAYALLLLSGLTVVVALLRNGGARVWAPCGGILLAALFLSASRAGWGAAAFILLAMVVVDRRTAAPLISMVLSGMLVVGLFFGMITVTNITQHTSLGSSSPGETGGTGAFSAKDALQAANESAMDVLRAANATESSDSERLTSLLDGWSLWTANPILGAGLGAYFEQSSGHGTALTIHNSLLWIAAEMGLVGLIIFAVGGGYVFLALWRRLKNPADMAATTLFLLLLGFAVMAMVHDLMYQRILWFIAGACLALPALKSAK